MAQLRRLSVPVYQPAAQLLAPEQQLAPLTQLEMSVVLDALRSQEDCYVLASRLALTRLDLGHAVLQSLSYCSQMTSLHLGYLRCTVEQLAGCLRGILQLAGLDSRKCKATL